MEPVKPLWLRSNCLLIRSLSESCRSGSHTAPLASSMGAYRRRRLTDTGSVLTINSPEIRERLGWCR